MANLIASIKVGGEWQDITPGTGTPYENCYDIVVQYPGWMQGGLPGDGPNDCHSFTVEETQRRCFKGKLTRQRFMELWADTYEDTEGEEAAANAGAYTSAGGTVVLGAVAAYAFFATNPVGWVVGAGLAIGTLLTAGGTILWVESDEFVTQRTEFRSVDSGLRRTGFSGEYSVEILKVRILGNPSEKVPCGEIPDSVKETYGPTHPVEDHLDKKGTVGKQDPYICEVDFTKETE